MQPEFSIFKTAQDDDQIRLFEDILRSNTGWMTAAAILSQMGEFVNEGAKRNLRRLANQTSHVISGAHGYRHLDHATADEIHHSIAFYESQAREMFARANRLRHRAHSRIG